MAKNVMTFLSSGKQAAVHISRQTQMGKPLADNPTSLVQKTVCLEDATVCKAITV